MEEAVVGFEILSSSYSEGTDVDHNEASDTVSRLIYKLWTFRLTPYFFKTSD
jgi:hypothetical protein